jgi:hypothetical protein
MPALQLEIEGTLLMQESEIAKNIRFHFLRLGFGIDFLQIHDDLLDGVLAVATLDNLEAWAVEAEDAFRHEQDALLVIFPKAASWSETRAAVQFRRHRKFFTIPSRAGRRRGAASLD